MRTGLLGRLSQGNRKVLIENFVSLSALEVVNMLMSFITLPYILRVLGQEGYGMYSMAFALIGYFTTLVDYAFSITGTRLVALNRDKSEQLQKVYSLVMKCKQNLFLVSCFFFIIIIGAIPAFRANYIAYVAAFPIVFGNMLFTDWFFQGIEKMKLVTIINASVKLLFTLGIFILVRNQEDVYVYILLQSISYVVAGIIAQVLIRRKYHIHKAKITLQECFAEIKDGSYLFINILLPNIYVAGSVLLLGLMHSSAEVGVFDSLRKITMLACSLIIVLTRVFFPYISRNQNSFARSAKITLYVAIFMVVALIVFYPIIFKYLNIDNLDYITVFAILALNLIGFSLNKTYGQNYLVTHGKDKEYLKATVIASITGFILSIPLIYYFGVRGAALTILVGNLISGGLCLFSYLSCPKTTISH